MSNTLEQPTQTARGQAEAPMTVQPPYTMSFLQSVSEMQVLALHNCQATAQILPTAPQFTVWSGQRRQLAGQRAVENLG